MTDAAQELQAALIRLEGTMLPQTRGEQQTALIKIERLRQEQDKRFKAAVKLAKESRP